MIQSKGPGAIDITRKVCSCLAESGIVRGLLTLFVRHTSASLLVQENADPQVLRDIEAYFRRLVPPGDPLFKHRSEGPDDMPAHLRSALTSTSISIPVLDGELCLGTWQGIYLYEHRDSPHERRIALQVFGD